MWNSGLRSKECNVTKSSFCADQKLVLITEEKTWEEALQHCRDLRLPSHDMCYDLATLETPDDHVFAREEARKVTDKEVGVKSVRAALSAADSEQAPCRAL